jgi:hypothetical protein
MRSFAWFGRAHGPLQSASELPRHADQARKRRLGGSPPMDVAVSPVDVAMEGFWLCD